MPTYDVIVAGAGPAGTQVARDLATRERDADVLLLDAGDLGQPPKSTGGITSADAIERFGIDDDLFQYRTDYVMLEGPAAPQDDQAYVRQRRPGGVLDFPAFKQERARDAESAGVELRDGTAVRAPVMEGGAVVGVRCGDGTVEHADIVVDATGENAVLAQELGVREPRPARRAIGREYEMEGVDLQNTEDAMMLRLDDEIARGGYAWIFHIGGDRAKVGVCWIDTEHTDGSGLNERLEQWLAEDPRLADAERIPGSDVHAGSAFIDTYSQLLREPKGKENVLFVGDTVSSIDPLWGEGITNCMASGRAAAEAIQEVLTGDRDVAEAAAVYASNWWDRVAPDRARRIRLGELTYGHSGDRYNRLMKRLREMGDGGLERLERADPRALARVAEPGDLGDILRFGLGRVHDRLRERAHAVSRRLGR